MYLHLDFESRSACDLKARGLDNYAKDPSTQVLMLAWALNDALPSLWLPHETPEIPEHLKLMLTRPEITKVAWNAEFERLIAREVLKIDIPISQWKDPSTYAKYASIAGSLEFVGNVLDLPEDEAKSTRGKKLIKLFCVPKKDGTFNDWNSHPEEWTEFCDYCCQDLVSERVILHKLKAFSLPPQEQIIWHLDQQINDRGIPVDLTFVAGARKIVEFEKAALLKEMLELTGLENPNSVKQMLGWLQTQEYEYKSLGARWVTKTLADPSSPLSEKGRRGLGLRQQLAKSSTAKLEALDSFVSADGILRRQYVYGGAARTLRWSGRAVQLQNLPRGTVKKVDEAVIAIREADVDKCRKFGSPLEVVSSCLRSAFRAPKGKHFVVCDLGAIENRGLGWGANCPAILDVFKKGLDPYVDFGTRFFELPYEDLDPEIDGLPEEEIQLRKGRRQLCKPAVLGCGYGLGGGKFDLDKNGDEIKTGLFGYAANMGVDITQDEALNMVQVFRAAYPEVPVFWKRLENAAMSAVRTGEKQAVNQFQFGAVPTKLLYLNLPSQRRLHYIRPNISLNTRLDGSEWVSLHYEGNQLNTTWGRTWTWGGKFCENAVQAISRDILAHGMRRATEEGFTVVGHTHDELICLEDNNSSMSLARLRDCMCERPKWALDMPLDADGFCSEIYRKG